ncbi:urea ABC transporter ATP-binding subunit UrtE [Sessilibacter corallicola]|uniref:urea ABC transporter ATP-binding subunit UrtE n=1 Tax=Sessilibacter corallicola TaxID=2904075 RepID=UPI001E2F676A|nr:urea ABC transporter ATP-binding subunit UrtE [Sessilibacter corallicola]MCE2027341.1 urea ABC transporter ATP-binding subunit UrtE [Sessilibacter corallicola]
MIELKQINQLYGGSQILWDLNLELTSGSLTCLLGRNGVGKTTLLKCIMGLLPVKSGTILIDGKDISRSPAHLRPKLGVGYVPQGRDIFPQLTVEENLRTGLAGRTDGSKKIPDLIFELFPVLDSMMKRRGGDLSGGQQQQLAIGRALTIEPKLLILDEPNEGIQPNIVQQIGDVIVRLNKEFNTTVLLVEQKLAFARRVGQDFHIMEKGRIVASGEMDNLSDEVVKEYLAV